MSRSDLKNQDRYESVGRSQREEYVNQHEPKISELAPKRYGWREQLYAWLVSW